jgi:hypothetical protein
MLEYNLNPKIQGKVHKLPLNYYAIYNVFFLLKLLKNCNVPILSSNIILTLY